MLYQGYMTSLFDYSPDDEYERNHEEALQDAMREQWKRDLATVRERGVITDWIGEPSPLSKDKARLLELLYDCGCVTWSSNPSKANQETTKAMGFQSQANAKACIDACLKEGLVVSRLYRGNMVFEMTAEGEYALEEHNLEIELGILSL